MDALRFAAEANRLSIEGPVNMGTATAVLEEALPHILAGDLALDLAAATNIDSAAVSVVLSLLRIAGESGHKLSVVNAPAAFDSLAALYGVDTLLTEHLSAHELH